MFDVFTPWQELYQHPEKYLLDSAKRSQAYIKSTDFKMEANGISPAGGYLFFDYLHPTSNVFAILAHQLHAKVLQKYRIIKPQGITDELPLNTKPARTYSR